MALKSFEDILAKARGEDSYWVETVKIAFASALATLAEQRGLRNVDLAARIGKSPAYVTKVFRGDQNFTIETMVKLARAVDAEFVFHLQPTFERSELKEFSEVLERGNFVADTKSPKFGKFTNRSSELNDAEFNANELLAA